MDTPGVKVQNPTAEVVKAYLPGSGYTGTALGFGYWIKLAYNATSTGTLAANHTNWINPEAGTVAAKAFVCFTTAGTGTMDMGRGNDGTGSASDMLLGATLTVGVHHQVTTATVTAGTVGETNKGWWLVGPGGTGTNNSIIMNHTDTPTSTAVGYMLINYIRVV